MMPTEEAFNGGQAIRDAVDRLRGGDPSRRGLKAMTMMPQLGCQGRNYW
jgi:hypothetical protein